MIWPRPKGLAEIEGANRPMRGMKRTRLSRRRSGPRARRIVLSAVVAALLLCAGGYMFLRRSLPQVAGTLEVAGLTAPVEIVRDRNAVPHIFAATPDDAYLALGFVHAQDRLWAMEVNRLQAAGRLAEVLGADALNADKFMRTLGLRHRADAVLGHLDAATRGTLDAYAAGINAFIRAKAGALPPEFVLFRHRPEPWTAADIVAWGKLLAWDLSGNWGVELARLRLRGRLSAAQLADFYPPYPGDAAAPPADLSDLYRRVAQSVDVERLAATLPQAAPEAVGSNNWVVAGGRSASGKPLLANDPHLGYRAPAVWYLAHLSAPGLEVVGGTLPGLPGVILGRNQRIAWGFTNTGPDTQDLFVEKIDAADPSLYHTPDGPRAFAVRQETIQVKGAEPVAVAVRESRHGPIVSDVIKLDPAALAPEYALALAWTSLRDDDLTIKAMLGLGRAADWPAFVETLRDWHSPQQSMVFADAAGDIGFIAPGRVPVRKRDNDVRGMAPAPGWDARYDWAGFIPFAELPRDLNAAGGSYLTANHKIVDGEYPHFLSYDWAEPYRAGRIAELLAGEAAHSRESFRRMQADAVSRMARQLLPLLLDSPARTAAARAAHDLLRDWNGDMSPERAEPLVFHAWYRELTRLIYGDELGPYFAAYWRQRPTFIHHVLADIDGKSRWCDDIATSERESCPEMISRALESALADLDKRYGGKLANLRWGEAHPALSAHTPFSRIAALRRLFEIRVPTPGDSYSVNVGRHDIADDAQPFASTHGPSFRAIYDLADLDASLFMLSTGQSGNLLSANYADMAEPWSRAVYHPVSARRADAEDGQLGTLILRPQ
jgi:penicillin G amidase